MELVLMEGRDLEQVEVVGGEVWRWEQEWWLQD
jgi:hypothetical protein